MAKLKDGFYKQTAESLGSDLYVLLAGGGSKPLSDFATVSDIPTVTNYYWADLKITSTASLITTPTVSSITAKSLFYLKSDDATLKIYPIAGLNSNNYGNEAVAMQTCFDGKDPSSSKYVTDYSSRTVLSLQPRGGRVGIGTTIPESVLHVNGDILANYYKYSFFGNTLSHGSNTYAWYNIYLGTINTVGDNILLNLSHSYYYTDTDSVSFMINVAYGKASITLLNSISGSKIFNLLRVRFVNNTTVFIDVNIYSYLAKTDKIYVSGLGHGDFKAPIATSDTTGTIKTFDIFYNGFSTENAYITSRLGIRNISPSTELHIKTAFQLGEIIDSTNTATGIRLDISGAQKGWIGWDNTYGTCLYNYSGAHYFGILPSGIPHYRGFDLRAYVFGAARDRTISTSTNLNTLTGSDGGWWGTLDNTTYTNGPYQNFGLLSLRLNNNYWGQLSLPYSSTTLPIKYRSLTWSSSGIVWKPWLSVMMERYGSSVCGTEAAWSVLAEWSTGQSTELGTDVTLYLHSSFSNRYGYLHIRVRRGEYLQARLLWSVNIDVSKIRVYYSSNYDNIQVAYLGGEVCSLITAELVADSDRSGSHSNRVACYHSYTAPSYTSYVTPTYDTLQQNISGSSDKLGGVSSSNYRRLDITQMFGSEVASNYYIGRCKENGGGWAYAPYLVYKGDKSTLLSNIGVYGTNNTLTYSYFGSNGWEGANLRVYPRGNIYCVGAEINGDITFSSSHSIGTCYSSSDFTKYNKITIHSATNGIMYDSGSWTRGDHQAHTFRVGTSNTEALVIRNNGRVGIGTNAPEDHLHINGNVRIKNSSGNRTLNLTGNLSSLRLFAWGDATYIESGNSDFSANKPLKITGIGGSTGSDLYLQFTNIYCRNGNYVNIDSGNIGSQSVNYANSSGNADTVDGYHVATTGNTKPWSRIVSIGSDGVSEMGRYIDFHYDNTTGSDYSTRLLCGGNYSNTVTLPSSSGTLALTSQIPTNTWRGITDSYSGTDSNISLSQKGGNALYNALVNGYASSAGVATEARVLCADATMKLYANYNNEVNFGGTTNSSTIYFGYRATDSKPKPTKFYFGTDSNCASVYGGAFYQVSDKKVKNNIKELPNDLINLVYNVKEVSFTWKNSGKEAFGYIAQDYEVISETFIDRGQDGTLTLNYTEVLVAQIAALKLKIVNLEERLRILEVPKN